MSFVLIRTLRTPSTHMCTQHRHLGEDFLIKVTRGSEIKVLTRAVQQLNMLPGADTKSQF